MADSFEELGQELINHFVILHPRPRDAEIVWCACKWKGSATDYAKHLGEVVKESMNFYTEWATKSNKFKIGYGNITSEFDDGEYWAEEFAKIYRDPKQGRLCHPESKSVYRFVSGWSE